MGTVYSAVFEKVAVTAAQDIFELNAGPDKQIALVGLVLSQDSDEGDAESEQLSILIHRGTTSGTGGSAITARPVNPGDPAFAGTVEANNTAQSTEGAQVHAQAWNIQSGLELWWPEECRPVVPKSGRIIIEQQDAPTDEITMSGTLYFMEL
jgi:hypothetical protein